MKKAAIFFLVLGTSLSFYSCQKRDFQLKTQKAASLYQVDVPDFMQAATGLNTDASMQFDNPQRETYLAILDESKKEFVDVFKELGEFNEEAGAVGNYQKVQMDYFTRYMHITRKGEPKKVTINGMPAEQVELVGRAPGIGYDVYYLMTFIEGSKNLYMMMVWTLGEQENEYKALFQEMAHSFKEL